VRGELSNGGILETKTTPVLSQTKSNLMKERKGSEQGSLRETVAVQANCTFEVHEELGMSVYVGAGSCLKDTRLTQHWVGESPPIVMVGKRPILCTDGDHGAGEWGRGTGRWGGWNPIVGEQA